MSVINYTRLPLMFVAVQSMDSVTILSIIPSNIDETNI